MIGSRTFFSLTPTIFFTLLLLQTHFVIGDQQPDEQQSLLLAHIGPDKKVSKKKLSKKQAQLADEKKIISFNYDNENLTDIINSLAEQKKVNVVLPSKEPDKIKTKVTVEILEKISLDEAWTLLATLLDTAGYSLIKQGDWYEIVKNSKFISTEPLPLYIGIAPDKLPDSDLRIRYIYYLSNLKIAPNANTDTNNELYSIFNQLLPKNKDEVRPPVFLDSQTNSIIISEKANAVKSVMKIIEYLDHIQLQEQLEIIKLRYLSAQLVADIFNSKIQTREPIRYPLDLKAPESSYFSQNVKIMPYNRMNAVLVLGKKQDIARVKDFIYKYLDIPLDSGKSILHVYQLQYLDAYTFAQTLNTIVKREIKQQPAQAAGQVQATDGIERYFDDVIITADLQKAAVVPTSIGKDAATNTGEYSGGNKLIIASTNEDWERIKKLIEELDVPQLQVVIEVLIAELTTAQTKLLGSMLRNPGCFPVPNSLNFQSAQLSGIVTGPNPSGRNPETLQADLMNQISPNNRAIPNFALPGTAAMSFNDKNGQTWGILEILDFITVGNIISNPHVIATNHTPTQVIVKQERYVPDAPVNLNAGATTITRKWITAPVTVNVTPRISSAEMVNLSLDINVNRFIQGATAAQAERGENLGINNRTIRTNANVRSGDILTLGGLNRIDDSNSRSQTPILGDIPIVGYFFKNRSQREDKTNLTLFICPTIIQPRLRSGISTYTTDYVNISKQYAKEGALFDSLRDPITRWFFRDQDSDPSSSIDGFMSQDELRRKEQLEPRDISDPEQRTAEKIIDRALKTPFKQQTLVLNDKLPAIVQSETKVAQVEQPLISESGKKVETELITHSVAPQSPLAGLADQIKQLYKDISLPETATT